MKSIGIRVAPKAVTYVIYDSSAREVVNVDSIVVPKALDVPESLKFVRNTVLDIIREYEVEKAGIRIPESIAQSSSRERVQLEGVIQESFASSDLRAYYCGQIANIAARVGIPRGDFNRYVKGEIVFEAVEGWAGHSPEEKEAMFTAIGAISA